MGKRISVFTADLGPTHLYVMDCSECGVVYGVAGSFQERRLNDGKSWYCPNGHKQMFVGPTPVEKRAKEAQERADRLATSLRAQQDQTHAAEREAAQARARELRLRWRVGNGVCPCCNRSFAALAAHVKTKHPEFVHEDFNQLSPSMVRALRFLRRAIDETDDAVVNVYVPWVNMNSVRALANRGLVERIDYEHVALTETGWPLAEHALASE